MPLDYGSFFHIIECIGISAFAISALSISTKQELDLLGLFIIAFLSALGGGVIRDVLTDTPPVSFLNYLNINIVLITILIGVALGLQRKNVDRHIIFIVSDALGLVSFAISGALAGIAAHFTIFGVMLLALVTAVGGGVMRDILLNQVPILVKKSDIYGSVALFVGLLVYIVSYFHIVNGFWLSTIFILGFTLRMIAYRYNWHLPNLR